MTAVSSSCYPIEAAALELLHLSDALRDDTTAPRLVYNGITAELLAMNGAAQTWGVAEPNVFFATLAQENRAAWFSSVRAASGMVTVGHGTLRYISRAVTCGAQQLRLVELSDEHSLLPVCEEAELRQATDEIFTVLDARGMYVDVNEAASRLAHLSREQVVGRSAAQVLRLSAPEARILQQAIRTALRGETQRLRWWYRPQSHALQVLDITLRGVRYHGMPAVFTHTRLAPLDTQDPTIGIRQRNNQLELANFLLTTAARFQRPSDLLEYMLRQLVAKTPVQSGAVYAYNPAAHRLHRRQRAGRSDARLPAELTLSAPAARRMARRSGRTTARLLVNEFEQLQSEQAVAVLPIYADNALHDVLVLTFSAGNVDVRAEVDELLKRLSGALNSFLTRDLLREELVASERRYQTLFDASTAGLLLTDGIRILEANRGAEKLLGYENGALRYLPAADLVAQANNSPPAAWSQLLTDTRLTGRPYTFEGYVRQASGQLLDAEVRLHRVMLPDGPCVQVLVRDLAERRVADAALLRVEVQRQSSRELRNLIGALHLAYVAFDREANIVAVNDYFCQQSGYAREELLGRNYFEVFAPDQQEYARRMAYYLHQVLEQQHLEPVYQSLIITKKKERLVMRWNRLFERDETGTIVSTISIGRDATADVLALEDSRLSRDRFQDLFDNAHDLIQHVAPDNRFLLVNRAWRETLGYSAEDLENLTLHDVVHPYYRAKLMYQLRALYRREAVNKLETVFLTKQGRSVHLIGSISCQWHDGAVLSTRIILHDITERIKAERLQKVYYSIANLAISTRDLDTLYAAIHRELSRLLDTRNFFIALCDEDRTQVAFVYFADMHAGPRALGRGRPFGRGIAEYVVTGGQPQFFLRHDLQLLIDADELMLHGMLPEVLLAAPLAVGGKVIGCIAVQDYTRADTYTTADLEVLHFISSQVALAIDRKRNELQLHRQNARLSAIFESGTHLMWSVNPQQQLTTYNRNFALAFFDGAEGRPSSADAPSLLAAQHESMDLRVVPHHHSDLWRQEYARAFAGEPRRFEVRTRQRDGSETWAEIYLNPIMLPNGALEEVSGIAHDITEKKLALLELARQEELFRGIFESFQDVYYRTDSLGRLTLLSPSVQEIFGYAPHEVAGHPAVEFYADPAEHSQLVARVREAGYVRGFEATFLDRQGQPRAVLINIRVLRNADGSFAGMEGLVMDIDELKQTQQDLLLAKQQAEAALHAKTQFLANMSHELRTPMNGIIGMIELLQHTVSSAEQADYVETLRRSSDALLAILNDILDLSKIQAGKLALNLAPTDLHETLDKLVALFANRAAQQQLAFGYEIDPMVPRYVVTDETRLLQILSNLTANAIKFTSEGSVAIRVMLREVEYDVEGRLELGFEVIDSGIGIAPEDAQRLFTDFTQLDTTSTKSYGGTGLGLSISRQLAELLDGDIGVQPNPARGSIFWFTIRAQPADEAAERQLRAARTQAREARKTGYFSNHPRVLLVDDNAVNLKVSGRMLERLGCRVILAENGFEALRLAANASEGADFALILMDIQMPDIDGLETTRRLRATRSATRRSCPPVVAMTAYSMQGDDERFLSQGFNGYVAKPVKSQDLFGALRQHCPHEPVIGARPELFPAPPSLPAPPDEAESLRPDPAVINQLLTIADADFLRQLFADFVTESTPLLAQAAEDLAAGRQEELLSPFHQIKGAGAQLGLTALADVARTLEQGVRSGQPVEMLLADFARLRAMFTTFGERYADWLPR